VSFDFLAKARSWFSPASLSLPALRFVQRSGAYISAVFTATRASLLGGQTGTLLCSVFVVRLTKKFKQKVVIFFQFSLVQAKGDASCSPR
jgi:hypothetical protein